MFTQTYKLVYEKDNKIYGSKNGLPVIDDDTCLIENIDAVDGVYKLVYEDGDAIKGSLSGIPADGDDTIFTAPAAEEEAIEEEPADDIEEPVVEETEPDDGEDELVEEDETPADDGEGEIED